MHLAIVFFGEREMVLNHIHNRTVPETKWEFTEDTVMAIAVFEQLERHGEINQDDLATPVLNKTQKKTGCLP